MDKTVVSHPQVLSWLRESILDSHVATFLAYLRDRRYARRPNTATSAHGSLCALAESREDASAASQRAGCQAVCFRSFVSLYLPLSGPPNQA